MEMVHEKIIYWLGVGLLGLGFCNSLPRYVNSAMLGSGMSNSQLRHVVSDLYAFTHESGNPKMDIEAALAQARANEVIARMNIDREFRVTNGEIKSQMFAAHCGRERALMDRTRIVIASPRPSVELFPRSM